MGMNSAPVTVAMPNASAASIYGSLAPEVQAQLRRTAEAIRSSRRRLIVEVMAIGEALLKVKAVLEHGQFGRWIAEEFSWSERSAQNYMRAHEAFGSNPQRVADLPLAQVYGLAALPAETRDRVLDEASKQEVKVSRLIAQEAWKAKQAAALATEEARKAALSPEARKAEEDRAKRQRRARVKKDEAWAAEEAKRKAEQEQEKASADKALALVRRRMPEAFDEFLKLVHASSYHFSAEVRRLLQDPQPSRMCSVEEAAE